MNGDDRGVWEVNQYERFTELWELLKAYPELPVIPIVSGAVVGEDGNGFNWMGSWNGADVDEYVKVRGSGYNEPSQIILKSNDDIFDTLERCLLPYDYDLLPESEEKCREIYNALPWKRAIIVYIGKPKGEEV